MKWKQWDKFRFYYSTYVKKEELSANNNFIYNPLLRKSDLNFIPILISPFPDGTDSGTTEG